ncbi:Bifunctional purine biosynthesis protein purH [Gemmatirosa kalamazoonensis]|uniref:Bifunctional purine biosynthesis protein PurH n=1 Tax=Gemmatirosa kalamazoonensis TaxID=861299 RepID=W0RIB6_9BACT|nr:bifunctional phosphoribosylaminoimidazolecarboxamide formyltransferase/IMP cyclohydrolase [Gemmatirosa kalamazoonensis]AHG90526.1 Bifunctional purine biosynthesis protein purH [Gemmatirosa kalamazoonensis]
MRALLSVSDKTGLVDLARGLMALGAELVSTGGTARALRDAGLQVMDVSEITGFPEMLDGRVKTLHPVVHGGLLARRDLPGHMDAIAAHDIQPIDVVVVNLYPFRETAARPGATRDDVVEQIDIGGPSMLRSAAKNHDAVTVVVDPADYDEVLGVLRGAAAEDLRVLRRRLAAKVFAHTAAYDAAIAAWFAEQEGDRFPARLTLAVERAQGLRYGENPHQRAAFYVERRGAGLGALVQRGGKELSFNNLLDLEGALLATDPFADETRACCAIVKHTTPCGLAIGATAREAYEKALACDPTSAFGGIIALTVPVDDEAAESISRLFVECVVAPEFTPGAIETLGRKKNLRILEGRAPADPRALDVKRVRGGLLVQDRLPAVSVDDGWTVVTDRAPTDEELDDLRFAWRAVASVKSNAIVLARGGATIGIGAGQMSRVDASFLAGHKARQLGHDTAGTALASDAFFPFRDGVDQAAAAGVRAIVQPGGSVRDAEVVAAANEHGMAMVFTGVRLFRH